MWGRIAGIQRRCDALDAEDESSIVQDLGGSRPSSVSQAGTWTSESMIESIDSSWRSELQIALLAGNGGRWWSRTTDLHDVNVALYP